MTNTPLFAQPKTNFKAKIIWADNCERTVDQYILFRKKVNISGCGKTEIAIFANTYYNLYVDGVFIHRGPVRRHESNACYDTINCELNKGEHTIAVLVHWLGNVFSAHRKATPAFWAEVKEENRDIIAATDDSWKAQYCPAFLHDEDYFFSQYDYSENIDMRKYPLGWEKPGFDDSAWKNAVVISEIGKAPDMHRNFTKRPIQLFSYVTRSMEITKRGKYTDGEKKKFPDVLKERTYDTDKKADGSFVVAALECSASATITVSYSNADEGCEIIAGYDDQIDDSGMPLPMRMAPYADRFVVPKGSGEVSVVMPRGLRYVLVCAAGRCVIDKITALCEEYPYTERAAFVSGDSYYTRLYGQSARTQRVCTIDGFTDCVNRERVLWLGDAYLDCLGNYYAEPDYGLILMTLYEHALGKKPSGAIGGYNSSDLQPDWLQMGAYNLMWLNMLCDYILFTGDEDSVLPLKDTAGGIIKFLCDSRNEDGIIDTDVNSCNTFWDWGYEEPMGESLKVTSYFMQTIERLSEFAYFDGVVPEKLLEGFAKTRENCYKRFWDSDRKVFHDSGKHGEPLHPLSTQGANIQAVSGGICPKDMCDEVVARIFDKTQLDEIPVGLYPPAENSYYDEKILPCATMYGGFYISKALFDNGYDEEAVRFIKEVWGDFDYLPTLPEMRRNGENQSTLTMCHGWSGAPAFLLPMYILGLRPVSAGWKDTLFAPPDVDISLVPSAKGVVKTPYGELSAQWTRLDGGMKISLNVPQEITVYVKVKDKTYSVNSGEHTFYTFA